MKQADGQTTQHESELLRQIFAEPGQATEGEEAVPLLDIPAGLTQRLYAIADDETALSQREPRQNIFSKALAKLSRLHVWKSLGAVAASAVIVAVMVQINEQRQTIAKLEQAQRDLAIALHYLNEANQAVEASLVNTLDSTMQKAAVEPVANSINAINVPKVERLKIREL